MPVPLRRRIAAALIVVVGCTVFWGIGAFICDLALYPPMPIFSDLRMLLLRLSSFLTWGGIGAIIGIAIKLSTDAPKWIVPFLGLVWGLSAFVWLGSRFVFDPSYFHAGTLLAILITALLIHVYVAPLAWWRVLILFVGVTAARYVVAGYTLISFLRDIDLVPYRSADISPEFIGLVFGSILALTLFIILANVTYQHPKTPIWRAFPITDHTKTLIKQFPPIPNRVITVSVLLCLLLGTIGGLAIILSQPPRSDSFDKLS